MNVLYKNIGLFLSVCVSITTVNGFCAQKDSVFQSYNLLTTIAGKGGAGDGVVNCWDPSFEGKPAIDAALSGPHMAMADSAGNVYIADKDAHAIRKVDRSGIITTVAGVNKSGDGKDGKATQQALNSPNGLWVTKKGELYILDLGNNKIRKVDLAGNMKTLYKDNSGIVGGRGLWVNKTEDTIWYSNMTAVKKWTAAEGAVVYADGFNDLGNICRDRNGNIIATDRGANMVYRLSTTGTKTAIAGNGQEKGVSNGRPALEIALYGVRGVWFLEDNSYFLALHEGSQVWYVDTENVAHLFLNGKEGDEVHSGDGQNFQSAGFKVSEVRAVTVDYQGNVLVTENDMGYIRKVTKAGVSVIRRQNQSPSCLVDLNVIHGNGLTKLTVHNFGVPNVHAKLVNQSGQKLNVPMSYHITGNVQEIQWENRNLPNGSYIFVLQNNGISLKQKFTYIR